MQRSWRSISQIAANKALHLTRLVSTFLAMLAHRTWCFVRLANGSVLRLGELGVRRKKGIEEMAKNEDQSLNIPRSKVRWLRWQLRLATVLFVFGIFLPMITISKFIIVKNSFSIVSGILELLRNGQLILFVVVAGFSIVMPVLKIRVLFKLLSKRAAKNPKANRYLHLMHEYGRWAMLDVMVVAVLIVTVKLGAIASIEVHSGLFVFGASVLLIMLITNKVVRLTSNSSRSPDGAAGTSAS